MCRSTCNLMYKICTLTSSKKYCQHVSLSFSMCRGVFITCTDGFAQAGSYYLSLLHSCWSSFTMFFHMVAWCSLWVHTFEESCTCFMLDSFHDTQETLAYLVPLSLQSKLTWLKYVFFIAIDVATCHFPKGLKNLTIPPEVHSGLFPKQLHTRYNLYSWETSQKENL